MRTITKNLLGAFAGVVLVTAGTTAMCAGAHEYRDRMLGDQAFNDRDYAQAVKFYQRYLTDAVNDDSAWIDAARRLVSAMLRDDRAVEALEVFKQLKIRLGKDIDMEDRLVEAEVMAYSGKLDDAKTLVEDLLHRMNTGGDEYARALDLLGYILLQKHNWTDAANVYAMLERNNDTPWEYKAYCKRVYALIMAGDSKEAGRLLTLNNRFNNIPNKTEAKGLSLLLLLKENKIKEFNDTFAGLRDSMEVAPNSVCYETMMLAYEKMTLAKDQEKAAFLLNQAFGFAIDAATRKQVLRTLINLYIKDNKPEKAAAVCEKYLSFYHNTPDAAEIQMQQASMLVWQKKYDAAVNVYYQVMNNTTLNIDVRLSAAKNVGAILAQNKKYDAAAKAFEFVYRQGSSKEEQAEALVHLGQLYFNQELYQRAIFTLREAADLSPAWRVTALYWTMRSYVQLKEYDAARNLIEAMKNLQCDPAIEADNAYYLGYILDKTGKLKEACDEYVLYARNYPSSPLVSQALFRAGDMAMDDKRYDAAAKIFADFTGRNPTHALVPAALYKQVYALFCAGSGSEAIKVVDRMNKDFPENSYTVAADQWEVDYFRDLGDLKKTEELLEEMNRRFAGKPAIVKDVLYDRAFVAFKSGEEKKALTLLDELMKMNLEPEAASRAWFLHGNIVSENGDYQTAVNSYSSCLKNQPGYELETACIGRLGDCYYSLYTKDKDENYLDQAIARYNMLSGRKQIDNTVWQQTLFKLGKCYEQKKDVDKALDYYKELIFNYKISSASGSYSRPVWLVKAAYAAIDLYTEKDTPEAAAAAIQVYNVLQGLNLNIGDDYRKMVERIKRKFKL